MKIGKVIIMIAAFAAAALLAPGCTQEEYPYKSGIETIKERGVLNVGVKNDVPGFGELVQNSDTGKKEYKGFEIDLAKKFANEILGDENKIAFVEVTAATRIDLLNNKEVDMVIATFTVDDERKQKYNFSPPYYTDSIGMLVLKTREGEFTDLADLGGKTIGVVRESTTQDAIEEAVKDLSITLDFVELSTDEEVDTALEEKKVDVFSIDKSILNGYLDEGTKVILGGPFKFAEQPYGIATKSSNIELAKLVYDRIETWLSDGTIDQLKKDNGLQ